MAALVSYVPEPCMLQLLQDNRLPMHLSHLKSTMVEELQFLSNIRPKVWQALGSACGMAPKALRSEVLTAGHISLAFMEMRAFSEAGKLPWTLGVGDIEQNLAQLKQQPEPSDATSWKIWHLLHIGYNVEQLKQGARLLMDAPCGASSAEQVHASATIFRKYHPEYGTETLMVRAFLHSLRLLMPGPTSFRHRPGESPLCSPRSPSTLLGGRSLSRTSCRSLPCGSKRGGCCLLPSRSPS